MSDKSTPTQNLPRTIANPKQPRLTCELCGRHSENTICEACADKVRADALAKKKREEKGAA